MTQLLYPLETTPGGSVALATTEAAKVAGALRTSLDTLRGERVYRPDFGRGIRTLDAPKAGEAMADARRAFTRGLEGRTPTDVRLSVRQDDGGALDIRVAYQVRGSDTLETL